MRVAAVADIHLKAEDQEKNIRQVTVVNELADVLVIAGDFTNHGKPEEMRACLAVLEHVHVPMVAVLGNHDRPRLASRLGAARRILAHGSSLRANARQAS